MKKALILIFICLSAVLANAYSFTYIVGAPTADVLEQGEYDIWTKIYRNNGMLIGTQIGLFPYITIGLSYGAENMVGNLYPDWHELFDANVKFRFFQETQMVPAFAIGFDSMGHGAWHKGLNRYDIKSKGFYLAASKHNILLPGFGAHIGVNRSLEVDDKDKDINAWVGLQQTIGDVVNVFVEYDLATNDNDRSIDADGFDLTGDGKGYLNAGVLVSISENLDIRLSLYDILKNNPNLGDYDNKDIVFDRAIKINFRTSF
ncbi:MAG: hypothetical protein JXR56_01855 [Candidatus Cloacimonetes bacterium]|nr:hypothetical protein [Candidatus Cloacimonadota bacterium]